MGTESELHEPSKEVPSSVLQMEQTLHEQSVFAVVPSLIIAFVSTTMKSGPLLLVSIMALGVPYFPLLLYRWKKVREFREMWSQVGEA